MAKRIKYSEDPDLRAVIGKQINNALGYLGGPLSAARRKSLEYYLGDKLGTEIDGRSQVVSTDVADTVESMLPNLLRIFTASDKVVRCDPVTAEDVPMADQATAYLNHVFYKENDGFKLLYNFFKDALIEKNGFLKVYYDESERIEYETYKNLNEDEYYALMDTDDDIEKIETEEIVDEKVKGQNELIIEKAEETIVDPAQLEIIKAQLPKPILHNCTLKRTIKKGMIKVESIMPDEFLINRNAKSIDEADFIAQRVYMTRSEIIQMGFEEEDVMRLPTAQVSLFNTENLVRQRPVSAFPIETPTDKSTEKVEIYECYVRYDFDKDGIAELRKVLTAGVEGAFILENSPCDTMPFVSVTPIPMPHRFYGRSIAELVEDIQLMKSTVMRQLLDNMYLTNNNRVAIMDGMVNMDDILTTRPGGIVRTKQPPNQVMQPIQAQPISQQAFPLLEYLDQVREVRTGVTKYNQGLDSESLNKTATGINAIMNQTQMRSELIVRIFAETGVKDLFRKMFALSVKYQDKEKIIKLNNEYIPVLPTEWKDRFNISISVGLGTGTKEQQVVMLNNILQKQLQAFELQGKRDYPMVTMKNMYNTLSKMVENAGLQTVESYFVDPIKGQQMVTPPPPPPISPIEKIEMARIDSENKRKLADLDLRSKEAQLDHQADLLDFEAKIKDMSLKYNTQLDTTKIKADAELDRVIIAHGSKNLEQAEKSASMFTKRFENINGQQRPRQAAQGIEQIISSQTDITE